MLTREEISEMHTRIRHVEDGVNLLKAQRSDEVKKIDEIYNVLIVKDPSLLVRVDRLEQSSRMIKFVVTNVMLAVIGLLVKAVIEILKVHV